jgi:hypothetical protein
VKYYEKHEQDVATLLGGRLTCSSGRKFFDKGDVKVGNIADEDALMLDAKCTQQGRYRLTHAVWHKLALEAAMTSRRPALPLRFLDERGGIVRDYVVVPYDMAENCEVSTWTNRFSTLAGYSITPETSSGSCFEIGNGVLSPVRLVVLDLDTFAESRSA